MARAGVVDADEPRGAKAGAEDGFLLGAEHLQLGGQEPPHLALRDRKAGRGQHGYDPLAGHLAVKMQRQNQAMQVRAAAAHDARRRIGRHRPPVRRRPALAPVERHLGFERDVLNDDLLVALGARTRRRRAVSVTVRSMLSFDTPGPRRRGGGPSAGFGLSDAAIRRLLHPRRLHRRPRRQALQTPDLVLQLLVLALGRRQRRIQLLILFPEPLNFADQSANHPDEFGQAQVPSELVDPGVIPGLNYAFKLLKLPSAPKSAPVTKVVTSFLAK